MIKLLHSLWAYLVIVMLFIAVINALIGMIGNRDFKAKDVRIPLFTLIVSHIQLLLGFILFFVSPLVQWFNSETEVSSIMKNSELRLYNLEHPLVMIIAIVLLTMGFSKHKKKLTAKGMFKSIFIYYLLALILILSRIPWKTWVIG